MAHGTDLEGFGSLLFNLVLLVVSTGLALHLWRGVGTKAWREAFLLSLLVYMVIIQLYYVLQAAATVPAYAKRDLQLYDCVQCTKGGKRSSLSRGIYEQNPCFCKGSVTCTITATGASVDPDLCPTDGSAICTRSDGKQMRRYIDSHRDCDSAKGIQCSKDEPCTPCQVDSLQAFGAPRCRSCLSQSDTQCNFVPEGGPYCYASPGSRDVVPCTNCCSELRLVFDSDGHCIY